MNTIVNSHFIKTEEKRHLLACSGDFKKLIKTYKKDVGLPLDLNNRVFWNRKITNEHSTLSSNSIYNDKLTKVSNFLRNKKGCILDIGIGYGDLEKSLIKNKDLHLSGIDISDISIKNAKKNFRGKFKVGSILNLPFKKESFDYVTALDVLEHIPPSRVLKAYKEIYRVLKHNGTLIVSIPINEHLDKMLQRGENPNGHMRVYTPELISSELKISGFTVSKSIYLYAFNSLYLLKTFIVNWLPFIYVEPNLYIVFTIKK